MLIAALLFLFVPSLLGDELISTRCQSKCLYDMEHRYQVGISFLSLSLFSISVWHLTRVYDSISCAYEYSGNIAGYPLDLTEETETFSDPNPSVSHGDTVLLCYVRLPEVFN